MIRDYLSVIGELYLVPRQDEHEIATGIPYHVDVLIKGVRSTQIPMRRFPVIRRMKDSDAAMFPVKVPWFAHPDMLYERFGIVLCQDIYICQSGMNAVAKAEICLLYTSDAADDTSEV